MSDRNRETLPLSEVKTRGGRTIAGVAEIARGRQEKREQTLEKAKQANGKLPAVIREFDNKQSEAFGVLQSSVGELKHADEALNHCIAALDTILSEDEYLRANSRQRIREDIALKRQELAHDRKMKLQGVWIAVLQRSASTIAIIAVAILTLITAKACEAPVPKWLAPVPADTHFKPGPASKTIKGVQEAIESGGKPGS